MSEGELTYADCTERLWAMLGDRADRSRALSRRADDDATGALNAFWGARDAIAAAAGDRVPGLAELLERLDESADELGRALLRSWGQERRWKLDRKRFRLFLSARRKAKGEACFQCGGRPVLARVRIESPTLYPAGSPQRSEHWICRPCAAKITGEVAARSRERYAPSPKPSEPAPRKPATESPSARHQASPSAAKPTDPLEGAPDRPRARRPRKR